MHDAPISGGDLGRTLAVDEQGSQDQACLRHARASPTRECRLCLEARVAYVLMEHTVSPTEETALTCGKVGSEAVRELEWSWCR